MLSILILGLLSALALAHDAAEPWKKAKFDTFVMFGDSYSDESRGAYFTNHNNQAPPKGWVGPVAEVTPSGGRVWPRYVVQYTGTQKGPTFDPSLTLYDYAVSGAVCSNKITLRTNPLDMSVFPDLSEYEVPAYRNDTAVLNPRPSTDGTVVALWIGTNDITNDAFLTDGETRGATLVDVMDCIFKTLEDIYSTGARNIVVVNLPPLDVAPLYANASAGGTNASYLWPNKSDFSPNVTLISEKIRQSTTTLNEIYRVRIPFEKLIEKKMPEANLALFDMHSLLLDEYNNPEKYLNGTAPLKVDKPYHMCEIGNFTNCQDDPSGQPDSFMFYDPSHPSEQTDRIIAREFVNIIKGKSKFATYW